MSLFTVGEFIYLLDFTLFIFVNGLVCLFACLFIYLSCSLLINKRIWIFGRVYLNWPNYLFKLVKYLLLVRYDFSF